MQYLIPLIFAFVPAERHLQDTAKTDLEQMQGVWLLIEAQRDPPALQEKMLNTIAVITGDEYKRFTNDNPPMIVRTLRLVANTNPREIDLIAKNQNGPDFIYKGIYEIRGPTLRFCFALQGRERPTEFRIGPNSTANSITTYRLLGRSR